MERTTVLELWTFTTPGVNLAMTDITGFKVEALDGEIGKIDEVTNEAGSSFVVLKTGPWIFGKKVMLPAGTIRDIDLDSETVYVNLTKDEIKNAPEFDETTYRGQSYRDDLSDYYGRSREPGSSDLL